MTIKDEEIICTCPDKSPITLDVIWHYVGCPARIKAKTDEEIKCKECDGLGFIFKKSPGRLELLQCHCIKSFDPYFKPSTESVYELVYNKAFKDGAASKDAIIQRMKETLGFYADEENHNPNYADYLKLLSPGQSISISEVQLDGGERATECLREVEEMEK